MLIQIPVRKNLFYYYLFKYFDVVIFIIGMQHRSKDKVLFKPAVGHKVDLRYYLCKDGDLINSYVRFCTLYHRFT